MAKVGKQKEREIEELLIQRQTNPDLTLPKIAKRCGVSYSTVDRVKLRLRSRGVAITSNNRRSDPLYLPTPQQIAEAANKIRKGNGMLPRVVNPCYD